MLDGDPVDRRRARRATWPAGCSSSGVAVAGVSAAAPLCADGARRTRRYDLGRAPPRRLAAGPCSSTLDPGRSTSPAGPRGIRRRGVPESARRRRAARRSRRPHPARSAGPGRQPGAPGTDAGRSSTPRPTTVRRGAWSADGDLLEDGRRRSRAPPLRRTVTAPSDPAGASGMTAGGRWRAGGRRRQRRTRRPDGSRPPPRLRPRPARHLLRGAGPTGGRPAWRSAGRTPRGSARTSGGDRVRRQPDRAARRRLLRQPRPRHRGRRGGRPTSRTGSAWTTCAASAPSRRAGQAAVAAVLRRFGPAGLSQVVVRHIQQQGEESWSVRLTVVTHRCREPSRRRSCAAARPRRG